MGRVFVDETGRTRTVWRFIIFGMGYLAVQTVLGIVVVVGLFGYLAATKTDFEAFFRSGKFLDSDWQVALQIILALPLTLGDLGLVLFCRKQLDRRSARSFGFVRPGRKLTDSVWGGLLLGALPIVYSAGALLITGALVWKGISWSWQTVLLVPTLVVMAFNEEIVCRGYLLQNLLDIRRPIFGVVFSSFVFWILHALNPAAWSSPIVSVNLFGAGITLALAYIVSRNIWFPTAMHFAWNVTQGVVFQIPISGIMTDGLFDVRLVDSAPLWLTGGSFGLEGSLLVTGAEVVMSVVMGVALFKRRSEVPIAVAEAPLAPLEPESIFLP
jgi:membrane protease YdiL (CAAX protease family)